MVIRANLHEQSPGQGGGRPGRKLLAARETMKVHEAYDGFRAACETLALVPRWQAFAASSSAVAAGSGEMLTLLALESAVAALQAAADGPTVTTAAGEAAATEAAAAARAAMQASAGAMEAAMVSLQHARGLVPDGGDAAAAADALMERGERAKGGAAAAEAAVEAAEHRWRLARDTHSLRSLLSGKVFEAANKARGSKVWHRSKLMAVGEGAAGKTVTFASLQGKPFVEKHMSTCGTAIAQLEVARGQELTQANWKGWETFVQSGSEHDTFTAETAAEVEALMPLTKATPADDDVVKRLCDLRERLGMSWKQLEQMGHFHPDCVANAKGAAAREMQKRKQKRLDLQEQARESKREKIAAAIEVLVKLTKATPGDVKGWEQSVQSGGEHDYSFLTELIAEIKALMPLTEATPADVGVVSRLGDLRERLGMSWEKLEQMKKFHPGCIANAKRAEEREVQERLRGEEEALELERKEIGALVPLTQDTPGDVGVVLQLGDLRKRLGITWEKLEQLGVHPSCIANAKAAAKHEKQTFEQKQLREEEAAREKIDAEVKMLVPLTHGTPADAGTVSRLGDLRKRLKKPWEELEQLGFHPDCIANAKEAVECEEQAREQARSAAENEKAERRREKAEEADDRAKRLNDLVLKIKKDGGVSRLVLSTWDFGGQMVFAALRHLFMTPFGGYLLVFSMVKLLDRATMLECFRHLDYWLRSLRMHAPTAPVFLIGTRADEVLEENRQLLSDKINKRYSGQSFFTPRKDLGTDVSGTIVWPDAGEVDQLVFFPVNNRDSGADPFIQQLQKRIEETLEDESYVNERVPCSWLDVFDKLTALACPTDDGVVEAKSRVVELERDHRSKLAQIKVEGGAGSNCPAREEAEALEAQLGLERAKAGELEAEALKRQPKRQIVSRADVMHIYCQIEVEALAPLTKATPADADVVSQLGGLRKRFKKKWEELEQLGFHPDCIANAKEAAEREGREGREQVALDSGIDAADAEVQVDAMLKLFHELGQFVYFSDDPELRDLVILDPQWLIDAISRVIRIYDTPSNRKKYGVESQEVPADSVRAASCAGGSDSVASSRPAPFGKGDKVVAKSKGSEQYYPGRVEHRNHDGTYSVKFEDGADAIIKSHRCPGDGATKATHCHEWAELTENGVLSGALAAELWAGITEADAKGVRRVTTDMLHFLLAKFGLAVPLRDTGGGGRAATKYLVPSLLPPPPTAAAPCGGCQRC
jgi:GTPase SAR1 family protein